MKFPQDWIGWLFEKVNMLDWQISILDIINTEKEYPGLIDDLSTEAWQRKLVREQMEDSKPKAEDGDGH